MNKIKLKFFNKYKLHLIMLAFFAVMVTIFYGSTLNNDFVFDNHQEIENYPYIRSVEFLPKVVTSSPSLYYRPMMNLSQLLTYQISTQPWIFHLDSLIYFTIDIFLIFILVRLLTKKTIIAFFAGLIFLIHPINSEAVNWISVGDPLSSIFILLSTIYYYLYKSRKKSKYLIFVYLFYGLGLMSKEQAILTPLIFLTLDLSFFKQKISSFLIWKNIRPYIICFIIFLCYLGLRFYALQGLGGAAGATHQLTLPQEIYMFFHLFAIYIQKLFWPYPLSFLYSSPPSDRFLSFEFFTGILSVLGYAYFIFLAYKRRWNIILFGLVWFLIFLLPSLLFINSALVIFAERYVFTPSIGFSIIMAIILNWFWEKKQQNKIAIGILLSIVSLISFMVISDRNMYWKSDVNIYQYELKKDPSSEVLRYDLAIAYRDKGDIKSAKKVFEEVIKTAKGDSLSKSYNNLGEISRREGNLDLALQYFNAAITADPDHKESYNNIGVLSMERGDVLVSILNLCKAITLDPGFTQANTNFEAAASMIQRLDNKSFMDLYDQILNSTVFKASNDYFALKNKDCSYPQGCLLTFSSKLPANVFLFPFLAVGKTDTGEVVRTRYLKFDPQTSDIILGIDREFGQKNIHFWFPTCDKVYEAEIKEE